MEMTLVVVSLSLAFILGIYLSIHFFFYRLKVSKPWCWLGAIVGGLMVGTVMAFIDFWIVYPPTSMLTVVVGVALMLIITMILIGYPKFWQSNNDLTLTK